MKYKQSKKQNQRIEQITEFTLVVGADIAKEIHVARGMNFLGIELGKDCVFSNDQAGMEKLILWMKELQRQHAKTDVILGIEPTGHYWFTLAEYLRGEGIRLVIVNPHHVKNSKTIHQRKMTTKMRKSSRISFAMANIQRHIYQKESMQICVFS